MMKNQLRVFTRIFSCLVFLFPVINFRTPAIPNLSISRQTSEVANQVLEDPDNPGYLESGWTLGTWQVDNAGSGLEMADIDGDGVQEVVVGNNSMWYVYSYSATTNRYEIEYRSKQYADGVAAVRIVNAGMEQGYQIYVLNIPLYYTDGSYFIEVYSCSNYRLISNRATPFYIGYNYEVKEMFIKDFDHDGNLEIIVGDKDDSYFMIVNAKTLEKIWTGTYPGEYNGFPIAVGNVDDDPAIEIITKTTVIDGATHAVEWQFPKSIYSLARTADIDNDGRDEVVGDSITGITYNLIAYDVDMQSQKWTIDMSYDQPTGMALQDVDGDGTIEMIVPMSTSKAINCYDSITHTLKWAFLEPNTNFWQVIAGDNNEDGKTEAILRGFAADLSSETHLYALDAVTPKIIWTSPTFGHFDYADGGDIDGDGRIEIVSNGCVLENGVAHYPIVVHDYLTKDLKWAGPLSGTSAKCDYGDPIWLANIDQDPAQEIIVPVNGPNNIYDGAVSIYDGITHQLEWQSPSILGYKVVAFQAADIDQDGHFEAILGQRPNNSNYHWPYFYVFDMTTGIQKWQSPGFTSFPYVNGWITNLKVEDFDGDAQMEIIASSQTYFAIYDGKTFTLELELKILGIQSFDFGDIDLDGKKEIVAGTGDGWIKVFDNLGNLKTQKAIFTTYTPPYFTGSINNLRLVDFNQDGILEILIATPVRLSLYHPKYDLQEFWESQELSNIFAPSFYSSNSTTNMVVKDLDLDGQPNVLVGDGYDATIFHYNPEAPGNLRFVPSLTGSKTIVAPDAPVSFRASLSSSYSTVHSFKVVFPTGYPTSLIGMPVPSKGQAVINYPNLEWTVSLDPGSSAYLDLSIYTPPNLDQSPYTFTANFQESGSPLILSPSVTMLVDWEPPVFTITQPKPDAVLSGERFTISGTASDDREVSQVEILIDNVGNWKLATGTTNWTYEWTLPDDGVHTLYVRAKDVAGNLAWGNLSGMKVYVSNPRPEVISITPSDGKINVLDFAPIRFKFNTSIRPETVSLSCDHGVVFAAPDYDGANLLLTFVHSPFPLGQTISCTLKDVQNTRGEAMLSPVVWSFTTSETAIHNYLPVALR